MKTVVDLSKCNVATVHTLKAAQSLGYRRGFLSRVAAAEAIHFQAPEQLAQALTVAARIVGMQKEAPIDMPYLNRREEATARKALAKLAAAANGSLQTRELMKPVLASWERKSEEPRGTHDKNCAQAYLQAIRQAGYVFPPAARTEKVADPIQLAAR